MCRMEHHGKQINEETLFKSLETLLSNASAAQRIEHCARLARLLEIFKTLKTKPPSSMTLTDITPFFKTSGGQPLDGTATNLVHLKNWNSKEFQIQFEKEGFEKVLQAKLADAFNQSPRSLFAKTANEAILLRFVEKLLTSVLEITMGTHLFAIQSECHLVSVPGVTSGGHVEIALGGAQGCPIILTIEAKTGHKDQHFAQVLAEAAAAHGYNWKYNTPAPVTYHVLWEYGIVNLYRVDSQPSGELSVTNIGKHQCEFPPPSEVASTDRTQLAKLSGKWQTLCRDLFQVLWMGAKSACEALEGKSAWRGEMGDFYASSSSSTESARPPQNDSTQVSVIPVSIALSPSDVQVEWVKQYIVALEDCVDAAKLARVRTACQIDPQISFSHDPAQKTPTRPRPSLSAWQKARGVAERIVQQMADERYPDSFSSLTTEFINALPVNSNGFRFYINEEAAMFDATNETDLGSEITFEWDNFKIVPKIVG